MGTQCEWGVRAQGRSSAAGAQTDATKLKRGPATAANSGAKFAGASYGTKT
jgi:hypothetical protein